MRQGVGDVVADAQHFLRPRLLLCTQALPQRRPVETGAFTMIGQAGGNELPVVVQCGGQHKRAGSVIDKKQEANTLAGFRG